MISLIEAALKHSRTLLLALFFLLSCGVYSFIHISRELNPDITVPFINVVTNHEGISPQDADRLIVNTLEQDLRTIEGLKEISSTAAQGRAVSILEFDTKTDIDQALLDVREKVEDAQSELPEDTDDPIVKEINLALFPVLLINLMGNADPGTLYQLAENLKDRIEAIPGVLSANIRGKRERVTEIIIDPDLMNSYNISQQQIFNLFQKNNRLIASGTLDNGAGRFPIKVPGLFTSPEEIYQLPIKVSGSRVIKISDVAVGHTTFKDPENIARFNGQTTVTLEVSKRIGANIIETIDQIRQTTANYSITWPDNISFQFAKDESKQIRDALADLQNNVLISTLSVMVVILCTLGIRSALLVGVAIPGSFLIAILCLHILGYTLNMVVLFALILAVGMLVDGAIVVTEFADRRINEGFHRRRAFSEAAKRMAWPITASTATTLAAFMPLLFWPGIVGKFMKFLPITLLATLTASLFMALVAIPVLGTLFSRKRRPSEEAIIKVESLNTNELLHMEGFIGHYLRTLNFAIHNPVKVLFSVFATLFVVLAAYASLGKGIQFFPEVEPNNAVVYIQAREDLSIYERDEIVQLAENKIIPIQGLRSVYATAVTRPPNNAPRDTIGIIHLEFLDWKSRLSTTKILTEVRRQLAAIAGIKHEIQKEKAGPAQGKPIQVALRTSDLDNLYLATEITRSWMENHRHFFDVQDNRPIPGIEWQFSMDRTKAAQFNADISQVGTAVRLVTTGLKVGEYRSAEISDETDIRIRYPISYRNLEQLQHLKLAREDRVIPFSNFVELKPKFKESSIYRGNGIREIVVEADISSNIPPNILVEELLSHLHQSLPSSVAFKLKGDQERQSEAEAFLIKAFIVAIFLMTIILVTQFNSFYQSFLILSAVVFSTIGVLIALIIRQQPFGVVMSGVGVIALAGIVVNNNIVLIDTYNNLKEQGLSAADAALRTGAQRLRPVILTTVTTILGLIPMVYQVTVNIMQREISIGAPVSQYWSQLSTAIAGGLAFATILTLILTPCLLVLRSGTQD